MPQQLAQRTNLTGVGFLCPNFEKNIDLAVVQDILGHSKITTMQRYAYPVQQRKLDAINILSTYTK